MYRVEFKQKNDPGAIMVKFKFAVFVLLSAFVAGCASLKLEPADFSWPLESVLEADAHGNVTENRYSFTLNVKPLFFAEFEDSTNVAGKSVRIIRNNQGYYFVTAEKFKNVYVFGTDEGALKEKNTILISEAGITEPAFNQRTPDIEFLNGGKKLLLDADGIKGE